MLKKTRKASRDNTEMDNILSYKDKEKSSYINIENNFSLNNKKYKNMKEKD